MIVKVDDDRGRPVIFPAAPKRVVSLVPSDTYTVAMLGRGETLVGRTDYCELPEEIVSKLPSVGGTKNPKLDAIVALAPDLVLANQEENTKKDLEELARQGIRVYVSFPKRVADGLSHVARLAKVFRVERDVKPLLKRGYEAVRDAEKDTRAKLRVFCPIWMKPLMTLNGDTFISDMLSLAGAENVFADRERKYPLAADLGRGVSIDAIGRDTRYPRVTEREVAARDPDVVILPDEPHPFSAEDAAVFRALLPRAKVVHTSGKDLCWYGARSIEGLPRVRAMIDALRDARP